MLGLVGYYRATSWSNWPEWNVKVMLSAWVYVMLNFVLNSWYFRETEGEKALKVGSAIFLWSSVGLYCASFIFGPLQDCRRRPIGALSVQLFCLYNVGGIQSLDDVCSQPTSLLLFWLKGGEHSNSMHRQRLGRSAPSHPSNDSPLHLTLLHCFRRGR